MSAVDPFPPDSHAPNTHQTAPARTGESRAVGEKQTHAAGNNNPGQGVSWDADRGTQSPTSDLGLAPDTSDAAGDPTTPTPPVPSLASTSPVPAAAAAAVSAVVTQTQTPWWGHPIVGFLRSGGIAALALVAGYWVGSPAGQAYMGHQPAATVSLEDVRRAVREEVAAYTAKPDALAAEAHRLHTTRHDDERKYLNDQFRLLHDRLDALTPESAAPRRRPR